MVIKIDKEAEKVLTEILDVYAKATGLRGIQTVNQVMSSVSLIKEISPEDDSKKINPKDLKPAK